MVPGLGQLYNGQPRKAGRFLLLTVFTVGPAILLITNGEDFGHSLLAGRHFALFLLVALGSVLVFLALFVLGLFFWASAAADARRTALLLRDGDEGEAAKIRFFHL